MTTLAELCEFIIDCEHRTAPTVTTGGHPLIRTPDVGVGRLNIEGAQRVSEDTYRAWTKRAIPRAGDLILAREAPVGNVGIVRPGVHPALGQRTVLIRSRSDVLDPHYLNYLMSAPELRGWMESVSSGATVPHLNVADIRSMELPPLPRLGAQRKIAAILSAYDDLIENNDRRIRLLEEMALRVYREWFVDFRYPGHESVPLVDSELGPIPKGWSLRPLFDVADITFGFPFRSELFNSEMGVPVIRIRDIPTGESGTLTTEVPGDTYRVEDGDILVGMDGEFHMGRWSAGEAWLNQRVARFRVASDTICRYTLFLALERPISDWNQAIVGTTVAHLGKRHLELIKIPTPPISLGTQLSAVLDPIFDLEIRLRKATRNLRATRDLLLPRLISGEIDVTHLDITLSEDSA